MDAHYERIRIKHRWDKPRVDRLCGFLRMNYGELASLLHMAHGEFKRRVLSPKQLPGPLCLLLTIMEHRYLHNYTKDTIANPFNFTDGQ